jgi:hypothetical protein
MRFKVMTLLALGLNPNRELESRDAQVMHAASMTLGA